MGAWVLGVGAAGSDLCGNEFVAGLRWVEVRCWLCVFECVCVLFDLYCGVKVFVFYCCYVLWYELCTYVVFCTCIWWNVSYGQINYLSISMSIYLFISVCLQIYIYLSIYRCCGVRSSNKLVEMSFGVWVCFGGVSAFQVLATVLCDVSKCIMRLH